MSVRLAFALLLLAALAGGLWWTASLPAEGSNAVAAPFEVFVVGPGGALISSGSIVARGTPLAVLQALADERGFTVEVEQQAWIGGGCTAAYVVGIAGQRETAAGGWNYYTRLPGGDWAWGSTGAACHRLADGAQVEWCWVESDVCRHHAA